MSFLLSTTFPHLKTAHFISGGFWFGFGFDKKPTLYLLAASVFMTSHTARYTSMIY